MQTAAALDQLTRQHTAFASFDALLTAEGGYRPSLYPGRFATAEEVTELRTLADAYDQAQAERGDARRAHRGCASWWRIPGAQPSRPQSTRQRALGRRGSVAPIRWLALNQSAGLDALKRESPGAGAGNTYPGPSPERLASALSSLVGTGGTLPPSLRRRKALLPARRWAERRSAP